MKKIIINFVLFLSFIFLNINFVFAQNMININVNDKNIKGILYENKAADSFKKLLPYNVTVSRLSDDLCGTTTANLDVDSKEDSDSWHIGEIGIFDGWFTILCDNEDGIRKRKRTIIGKISENDIKYIKSLKGTVDLVITLDTNNMDIKQIKLNSGYEMPMNGLGTWSLYGKTCEDSVYNAIKCGVRLIDTAQYYGNEEDVGKAIKKAIDDKLVKREELFITTKVMPSNFENAKASIDESLKKLGLTYIDLFLIHQHGSNDKEVYKALENGVKDGKIKSIGVSNFYTKDEYDELMKYAVTTPSVIQNENHIFYNNDELKKYVEKDGVIIESYYPLGGRGHTKDTLNNDLIKELAKKYKKSEAQIILRWHLQKGYIAIPGSSNKEHIEENNNIYDFEITSEDMQKIEKLNTNKRYENW